MPLVFGPNQNASLCKHEKGIFSYDALTIFEKKAKTIGGNPPPYVTRVKFNFVMVN